MDSAELPIDSFCCVIFQMALTIWRDDFLSDVIVPLVDASLQLVQLDRTGEQVNLELVESVAHCLGKTSTFCHSCSFLRSLVDRHMIFEGYS